MHYRPLSLLGIGTSIKVAEWNMFYGAKSLSVWLLIILFKDITIYRGENKIFFYFYDDDGTVRS